MDTDSGKEAKPLKHGGREAAEEIAGTAEIGKAKTSPRINMETRRKIR